jgi:hypothetical protein
MTKVPKGKSFLLKSWIGDIDELKTRTVKSITDELNG